MIASLTMSLPSSSFLTGICGRSRVLAPPTLVPPVKGSNLPDGRGRRTVCWPRPSRRPCSPGGCTLPRKPIMPCQVSPTMSAWNFVRRRGPVHQDGGFLALTNLPRGGILRLHRDRRRVRDDVVRHHVLPFLRAIGIDQQVVPFRCSHRLRLRAATAGGKCIHASPDCYQRRSPRQCTPGLQQIPSIFTEI